jgi:hypothetical protein
MKHLGFALGLVVLFAAFMAAPYLIPTVEGAYAASVLALGAMLVLIGLFVVGRPLGILVNERNTMSLTRFQTVLWTVLITAAFSTLLLGAIYKGKDPAALVKEAMRPDLLALMGISYASAVTASAMQASKSGKEATGAAVAKSQAINGPTTDKPQGVLFANIDPKHATITDMFEGDEVADAHLVDMAKVQMFFFTIVSAAYFISRMWPTGLPVTLVPQLPTNLIALMGISHAGYLGSKSVTKTPEVQPGAQPQPGAEVQLNPQPEPPGKPVSVVTTTQPTPVQPPAKP